MDLFLWIEASYQTIKGKLLSQVFWPVLSANLAWSDTILGLSILIHLEPFPAQPFRKLSASKS